MCVDCSIAADSQCTNSSVANCINFAYDSLSAVCKDCTASYYDSTSASYLCTNSAVTGCSTYKYSSGSCIDCSVSVGTTCINAGLSAC